MTDSTRGHCFCGAIRFEFAGTPLWTCFCHCESCRRNTSSPVTAFLGLPRAEVRWAGPALRQFRSTRGVTRSFCGDCGAPLAFESDRWPGEIHLYLASLEDVEKFKPEFHVHCDERVSWLNLNDSLKQYPKNS